MTQHVDGHTDSGSSLHGSAVEQLEDTPQLPLPGLARFGPSQIPVSTGEAQRTCVIYVRVSTIAQEDGFSPEIQRRYGHTLAAREELQVLEVIEETASGLDTERPGLQRVMQLIERRRVGHVVAYAIDRISRETWHGLYFASSCKRHGVRLWDAKSGRERYHTDDDRLLVEIESVLAGFEHRKIVSRMRTGKRQRAIEGHPSQRCPYGYRYVRDMARRKQDKGHWEICEDEAMIIREIFTRYLAGETLTQIAAELTTRKVTRAPYPGAPRTVGAAHLWRPALISAILNCQTYTGVHRTYHRRRVPTPAGSRWKTRRMPLPEDEQVSISVPQIIAPELFDTVAALRERNARHLRKVAANDVLLSGHLWCGTCGASMGRDTSLQQRGPSKGTMYVYYRCRHDHRYGWVPHSQSTRSAARLDTDVWEVLTAILKTPYVLQEALTVGQTQDPHAAQIQAMEAERTRLQTALAKNATAQVNLVELASAHHQEIRAVSQKLQALQTQEIELEAELVRLERTAQTLAPVARPTADDLTTVCQRMEAELASRDMAERRTLLAALKLTVVWHPEDHTLELWGTLPLATPLPFHWESGICTVPPRRAFTPGKPLPSPRGSMSPPLLAAGD